jgi:DNA (cytosine-5)-methyltransferase 1
MKYLSVCSGIEAATVAWHPLGWKPSAFAEVDKFPSKVLAHHYPDVPNLGDMTQFKEWDIGSIDLLVGGTPCQSFSVAGLRKGLDDPRGNLMLTFLAIAKRFSPRWLVWENVPGVLSSNGGRDFGSFLGGLGHCGYGFAYRVLDAQYFGVAQRRRRVFVVGCLGDWRCAAAVLFERHCMSGNPAPSREKGKVTPTLSSSGTGVSRVGFNCEEQWFIEAPVAARMVSFGEYSIDGTASSMKARDYKDATDLVAQPIDFRNFRFHEGKVAGTMQAKATGGYSLNYETGVMQPITMRESGHGYWMRDEIAGTLRAEGEDRPSRPSHAIMLNTMRVRRLTPMECERLQGFPDNYTNIPSAADGPRYKALGNSMAVPVMHWIGKRIQMVEDLC